MSKEMTLDDQSFLGPGVDFKGKIKTDGDLAVKGAKVSGEINSMGQVIISSGSCVAGSVKAQKVTIEAGTKVDATVKSGT